jgi:hypothetical protein
VNCERIEEAAKASEDAVVLVEQEVVLRGNGSTAMEGTKVCVSLYIGSFLLWLWVCAYLGCLLVRL